MFEQSFLIGIELCRGRKEEADKYWKKLEKCIVEKDGKGRQCMFEPFDAEKTTTTTKKQLLFSECEVLVCLVLYAVSLWYLW